MLRHDFNTQELIDQWLDQENNGIEFPVDLDIAWQLAGYKKKQEGLINCRNNLIEGVDFSQKSVKNPSGKGRSVIKMFLTCDGLKQLCLLARTPEGRDVRQYFIECEKKWKLTQKMFPQVAQSVEDIRLDKQIELEKLRLSNNQLDNTMLQLHGKETVLLLRGLKENIVTVENTVTEVLDVRNNHAEKILSADQLTSTIKKRTGQKPASMKWVVDTVKKLGRHDLITTVNRAVSNEYIKADCLDEVIDLLYGESRQGLIGE